MARMHSRKKGKSGSTRPVTNHTPAWGSYGANEVEMLVAKLAKDGKSASQIGISLRDSYGIPDVKAVTKKSILAILKDKKLDSEIPEDLMALIRKMILIQKHRETNKKDQPAKRGLKLTDSKMRRLIKYYIRSGRLPKGWTYDPAKLRLLVE